MRLALFQPDIPQNTGAMIRICACFDVGIDIIHPTGYVFNKKNIKQAAMDYISLVSLQEHDSWNSYLESNKGKRIILSASKLFTALAVVWLKGCQYRIDINTFTSSAKCLSFSFK